MMMRRKLLARHVMHLHNRGDAIHFSGEIKKSRRKVFWHQKENRLAASPKYSASVMKEVTKLLGLTSPAEWKELQKEL